jgi:hypothetical protein
MGAAMRVWLAICALVSASCIGTSPEQARVQELIALGADEDGSEEHNPGFPCGDCHGESFAQAGTVFLFARDADEDGLAGVTVYIEDALGRRASAVSNDAGNFLFEVGAGGGSSRDGRARIDFSPQYPITTWIEQGGTEQRMLTPIRRTPSCASCHFREPGAASVGRVFLMEPAP